MLTTQTTTLSSGLINKMTNTPKKVLPALFISHGAPSLALEKSATTNALNKIGQNLPKPKAIVVMSAHWQSAYLTINSNPKPATWHDFKGLDKRLYELSYPALGHQTLAESLAHQLQDNNIACRLNPVRAFDHGVWVPLLHIFPKADIPVVQISLPQNYDAYACYQLGALFASLRNEQVLIIGSGSITHNLNKLNWHATTQDKIANDFKTWMLNKLKHDVPSALDWQKFEGYKDVHPTNEHLLPLFYALGAGQRVSVVHQSMVHHSLGMDILRFD